MWFITFLCMWLRELIPFHFPNHCPQFTQDQMVGNSMACFFVCFRLMHKWDHFEHESGDCFLSVLAIKVLDSERRHVFVPSHWLRPCSDLDAEWALDTQGKDTCQEYGCIFFIYFCKNIKKDIWICIAHYGTVVIFKISKGSSGSTCIQ